MKMEVLNIVASGANLVAAINRKNMSTLIITEIVNQNARNVHGMQISIAPKTLESYLLPLSIICITICYFPSIPKSIHQNTVVFLMKSLKKSSFSLNMEIYRLPPNEGC